MKENYINEKSCGCVVRITETIIEITACIQHEKKWNFKIKLCKME